MYEEYLEDYVYKIMAKIAARICRVFNKRAHTNNESDKSVIVKSNTTTDIIQDVKALEEVGPEDEDSTIGTTETAGDNEQPICDDNGIKSKEDVDEELNNLNFHMMLFFMWLMVTLVNVPALLTWARNFKYSMVLTPDTSYHTGLVMSVCSTFIWQMNGPRRNLRYYEAVSSLLFTMAVFVLTLGPFSLTIVNYGVTFMFVVITLQQICDKNENVALNTNDSKSEHPSESDNQNSKEKSENNSKNKPSEFDSSDNNKADGIHEGSKNATPECDPCNESRIYNMFKNLREKLSFSDNV